MDASISLLGKITIINIMVGVLSFIIAVYLIFREPDNSAAISTGAFTLLFAFTYLWVGANQFLKADGAGLGWFCFFVSITAAFVGASSIADIGINFELWNTFSWFAWSALWFSFFCLLALAKKIQYSVAIYTLFCAVFTGWIPGVLILLGIINA